MEWVRRRDLEGGKELGVWLLVEDDGTVDTELYVESHRYRGEDYDVYTATPEGEWTHEGTFDDRKSAFNRAIEYMGSSPYSLSGEE